MVEVRSNYSINGRDFFFFFLHFLGRNDVSVVTVVVVSVESFGENNVVPCDENIFCKLWEIRIFFFSPKVRNLKKKMNFLD